jgi:hypothetical protein
MALVRELAGFMSSLTRIHTLVIIEKFAQADPPVPLLRGSNRRERDDYTGIPSNARFG